MKKIILFFIVILCFIIYSPNSYSIGVFGFGSISPSIMNSDYVQYAGCGAGIVLDTSWIITAGIDNPIFHNYYGKFQDTITNLSPELFHNKYYLQFARSFDITDGIKISPSIFADLNLIYYRTVFPTNYTSEIIYPTFGSVLFFSITPNFNVIFNSYSWGRITAGISYSIPINLKYDIQNSNGNQMRNRDMNLLSLILTLQLGRFR